MNRTEAVPTILGFARYRLKEGASADQLIEYSWNLQQQFINQQHGILKHWLLGYLKGEFADAILAVDEQSFDAMSKGYQSEDSAAALFTLLDPESITLRKNKILKPIADIPSGFSCIEYGTFKPKRGGSFSIESLQIASKNIEENYLHDSDNTVERFVGQVDDDTYSEVVFGKTLGQTKRTCFGYVGNAVCEELLGLFDPDTVDLDFWYILD
ncbi:hypothetical protein GQR58_029178 [Nymphon striatum]|nr:hypothetical protein GQR58_029178 [Nymphon striatum]